MEVSSLVEGRGRGESQALLESQVMLRVESGNEISCPNVEVVERGNQGW